MNWHQSLCCGPNDFETTCLALWLPCVAFGFNKQKLDTIENKISPQWCGPAFAYCGSNVLGSILCFSYGTCMLSSTHIALTPDIINLLSSTGALIGTSCYAGHFRKQLRDKYNIEGSLTNDICTHMFCSPCALCQETAEIQKQHEIEQDFTKTPYVQVMT